MDGAMVTESSIKEPQEYCIKYCKHGKEKMKELLQTCESVFDAVADMRDFVQNCFKSSNCPFKEGQEKTC